MTPLTRPEAAALLKLVNFVGTGEAVKALLSPAELEAARTGYQKLAAFVERSR